MSFRVGDKVRVKDSPIFRKWGISGAEGRITQLKTYKKCPVAILQMCWGFYGAMFYLEELKKLERM